MEIKELKEGIKALGEIAYFGGSVMKNDKIGLEDIPAFVVLMTKIEVLSEGLKGADGMAEEIKDLKQDEVMELLGDVYLAVNRFSEGKNS